MNHYYKIIKAIVKVIAEMEHTRIEKSRHRRVLEDDLKRTHQHLRSAEAAIAQKQEEVREVLRAADDLTDRLTEKEKEIERLKAELNHFVDANKKVR